MLTKYVAGLVFAASLASAAPITVYFKFSGGGGAGTLDNTLVFQGYSDVGFTNAVNLTVTAKAYGTGDNTTHTNGTTLRTAALGQWGSGLGVCDQIEQGVVSGKSATRSCSDPHHRVDNERSLNFVHLQFSSPVNENPYVWLDYVGDTDVSYWWGSNVPGTILGTNPTTAAGRKDQYDLGEDQWRKLNDATGSSGSLLFGAKVGSTNDKFKFEYMKVQWEEPPNDQGVPEPATMSLMGAALIAVGLYRRRQA